MKPVLLSIATLALVAACGEHSTSAERGAAADQPAKKTESVADGDEPKYTRQDVPGSVEGREVKEVTLDEIKPAFTEATVLKLNAIVRRSLGAATEYSKSVKKIRSAVDAAAAPGATSAQRDEAAAGVAKLKSLY